MTNTILLINILCFAAFRTFSTTYGDTAFIFMGDAEELSEGHITGNVSADVLKVGHHGSELTPKS
jgi:beta-lactamase superfamily II metal-dependent hydrolase